MVCEKSRELHGIANRLPDNDENHYELLPEGPALVGRS